MSRKNILKIGFIGNIVIMVFMQIVILVGFFTKSEAVEGFVFGDTILAIRSFLGFLLFAYWIYLIILWSKHDKHIGRFFALLFLIGWYSIYYSYWLLKRKPEVFY